MIDLCSSFKFNAPKQIWKSAFSHFTKNGLESEGMLREMHEFPYLLVKFFWVTRYTGIKFHTETEFGTEFEFFNGKSLYWRQEQLFLCILFELFS